MTKVKQKSAAAIKRGEIKDFIEWYNGPKAKLTTPNEEELEELGFPAEFDYRQNEIHIVKGKDRWGQKLYYYILSTYNEKSEYGDFLLNERSFDIILEKDMEEKITNWSLAFAVYKAKNTINSYITPLSDIDRDYSTDSDITIKVFKDKDAGNAISVKRSYKGVLTLQSSSKNRKKVDKGYKNRKPKK